MGNKKEYNQYLWAPEQPRVYETSPLRISGTPMSEEDVAMSLRAENLQQSLQQNPIFKSAKQRVAQQKQREKEIAASKKWLELHPEDNNDDPYTIFERGKHQAIVDGKDPSYYEKMINDGKQFTKGALTVLSLPYLSAAAAGAYGYGASLGARGLFAAQGIHGLANKDGIRKTVNLIKSGNYGRATLSGIGDTLNAAMVLPGAKFLGSTAKYGLKSTVTRDMLGQNVRNAALATSEPLLNVGWGPRQTLKVSRAGEYDQMYFPKRWDVVNEGANPHGVWLQGKYGTPRTDLTNPGKGAKAARARNVFSTRSDKYTGTVTLDKPMVTVGEVPNRSSLSYQADNIGADGLIYNGVYDNGYNNNQVILSFRRPELTKIQLSKAERLGIPKGDRGNLSQDQLDALEDLTSYMQSFRRPKLTKTQLSEAERLDVPKDLSPNISRSLGFSSTTGEELFMPNEILGEFVSGKNQAAKFFQQPVVQNSYAHNKELANRLGINIADRPENISEIVGAPIKLSPYIQNPGNELANIAQSYLGDPSATLSIAWTPFSKRVAKLTGIHEGLHRGHYAQVIKPAPPITKNYYETTMRPEATFWNWKINKLLKPEYQNGYLGGPFDGEAGVNLIEMGRDMGVKLGTKYPGDEVFMNMINNYNGHKSFLIPHLDLDTRAGRRHVWDAMTGQYFKQGGILKRVESGKSGIHIKPENQGKFTALKKRTGKSSTWYKEHGTPAQKKMAVFALNARKWKHK